MKWDVFYEKINDWSISTSSSKISSLEDIGTPDEVTDAINILAFDDEKVATKLLNKALNFGVKFTGENLAELCDICSEESFKRALYDSALLFTKDDLEELFGCIDDELILDIARKYSLKLPEDLAEDYEEEFCQDTSASISWDYFYEHFCDWSEDFARKRLAAVTGYGTEDEVIEVLMDLFDSSEKEASAFIQKALDGGVRFGLDNLMELTCTCDENTVNRAVLLYASKLSADDIEELYGNVDDALIEKICKLHNKPLPEDLRYMTEDDDIEAVDDINYLIEEALGQAVYAKDCLYELQNCLNTSGNISFLDMISKSFFPSLMKYSSLKDSEAQMRITAQALEDLNYSLKLLRKNKAVKLKGIQLSSAIDLWFDSGFFDALVHLQIGKVQNKTKKAIMQVQNIIRELESMK